MKTFQQFLQFLEEKKISKKQQRELTKGIVVKPDVERESDGTLRYTLTKPPVPTKPNSPERRIQTKAIEKASGAKSFEK